jgi:hypothetical protein
MLDAHSIEKQRDLSSVVDFLWWKGQIFQENRGSLLEEIPAEFWAQLLLRQDHILADSISISLVGVGCSSDNTFQAENKSNIVLGLCSGSDIHIITG